ncbi:MAG TPA: hypothetical protein VKA00_00770 [Trueperaceae bacterium]|nr:hypothetical protein [Trueperaceae bacterium]
MSLDTLLSVLFLLVFIVLPLLSRAFRQGPRAGGGGPQQRPPASPEDAEAPPWLAEAQRRVREARQAVGEARERGQATPERSAPDASPSPRQRTLVSEDPFERAEWPSGERTLVPEDPFRQASPRSRGGGMVSEDPFERGLVAGPGTARAGATHADDTLGREGVPAPRPRPTAASGRGAPRNEEPAPGMEDASRARRRRARSGGVRLMGGDADDPTVSAHGRRRGGAAGARVRSVDLMRFDGRAIVSGLIWHEILDEPAWKRRSWRTSSRPRSR